MDSCQVNLNKFSICTFALSSSSVPIHIGRVQRGRNSEWELIRGIREKIYLKNKINLMNA